MEQFQILSEINNLRQNPKSYIAILQAQMKHIKGVILDVPGQTPIELTEGVKAYRETIDFLKTQKSAPALRLSRQLEFACNDHLQDILKATSHDQLNHTGSDKSTYKDRIERYCRWGGSIFEALDFAPRYSAQDIVVAWLVDDGVPKRTHRTQLFNQRMTEAAALSAQHSQFGIQCSVALFAAQIEPPQSLQVAASRQGKIAKLNFSTLCQEVVQLINAVRQNPKSFVPVLEKSLNRFKQGNLYETADQLLLIQTKEGPIAYVEAIEFLMQQKSLKGFCWNDKLARAAQEHSMDLQMTQQIGILGSDGSLPADRIARHCNIDQTWAECIVFGCTTAQEVVEQLIVNDGQPHVRGFRSTLFKTDLSMIGVAGNPHAKEDSVILLVFAKDVLKSGQKQKVSVTVTDKISQGLIDRMNQIGIDTSRIKVIPDSNLQVTEQRVNKIFKSDEPQLRVSVGREENKEPKKRKSKAERNQRKEVTTFNVDADPDYPETAVNSHVTVEMIEINGVTQKVIKKSYQLVDGSIHTVTRIEKVI